MTTTRQAERAPARHDVDAQVDVEVRADAPKQAPAETKPDNAPKDDYQRAPAAPKKPKPKWDISDGAGHEAKDIARLVKGWTSGDEQGDIRAIFEGYVIGDPNDPNPPDVQKRLYTELMLALGDEGVSYGRIVSELDNKSARASFLRVTLPLTSPKDQVSAVRHASESWIWRLLRWIGRMSSDAQTTAAVFKHIGKSENASAAFYKAADEAKLDWVRDPAKVKVAIADVDPATNVMLVSVDADPANALLFATPTGKLPVTEADFDRQSVAGKAANAKTMLARIDSLRDAKMPPDVKAAAEVLANPDAKKVDRAAALATYSAWAKTEAAAQEDARKGFITERENLEGLIGDDKHPGLYERMVTRAETLKAQFQKQADKGDKNAKAIVKDCDAIIAFAKKEEKAARALYKEYLARTSVATGGSAYAGKALDDTVLLMQGNEAVFTDFDALADKSKAIAEAAGGKIPDELLNPAPWIEHADKLQKRYDALLKQRAWLEEKAAADPDFATWLRESDLLGTLDLQEQALRSQMDDTSAVLIAQTSQLLSGQAAHVLGMRDEYTAFATASVGALQTEDDHKLEAREKGLKQRVSVLDGEIKALETLEKATKKEIAELEKKPRPLDAKDTWRLAELKMTLDGVVPQKDGTTISLKEQIRALKETRTSCEQAREMIDKRHEIIIGAIDSAASGYTISVKTDATATGTVKAIDKLEAQFPLTPSDDPKLSLTQTARGYELRIGDEVYKLNQSDPISPFSEILKFTTAYQTLHRHQQAVTYMVYRQLLDQMGFSGKELTQLGFDKLKYDPNDPRTLPDPAFMAQKLPKLLALYCNCQGYSATDSNYQQLIAWAQAPKAETYPKLNATQPDAGAAYLLFAFAQGEKPGSYYVSRDQLIRIVSDPDAAMQYLMGLDEDTVKKLLGGRYPDPINERDALVSLAAALLTKPDFARAMAVDEHGRIPQHRVVEWGEQKETLDAYKPILAAKQKDKELYLANAAKSGGELPKEMPAPEYFANAEKLVDKMDPQLHPWLWEGNGLFELLKDLNAGQRAYVLGLFDAKYSKLYGADHLEKLIGMHKPGAALAFVYFATGPTAQEEGVNFKEKYLANGKVDAFFTEQQDKYDLLVENDKKAGIDIPKNMLDDYGDRLAAARKLQQPVVDARKEYERLLKEYETAQKAGAENLGDLHKALTKSYEALGDAERRLIQAAGELMVLGEGLTRGAAAEDLYYKEAKKNFRSFAKMFAITVGAMAATLLTAGALAPTMGPVGAGLIAAAVGTGAGFTVSFVWHAGEQLVDGGVGNMSFTDSFDGAVDDLPIAIMGSLPVAFPAAWAGRAGQFYKAAQAARAIEVAGVTFRPAMVAAHLKTAGLIGVTTAAGTMAGDLAVAGYYAARAKLADDPAKADAFRKAADETMGNTVKDGAMAGASAMVFLPLARFGPVIDGGTNAVQTAFTNWAFNEKQSVSDAFFMGVALSKVGEKVGDVRAAGEIDPKKAIGEEVRLPGDQSGYKVTGIDEATGRVTVEGGEPPRMKRVSAKVIAKLNPHLRIDAAGGRAEVLIGSQPDPVQPAKSKKHGAKKGAGKPPPIPPGKTTGASLDVHEAGRFFTPGSEFSIAKIALAPDVLAKNVTIAKDGTVHGVVPPKTKPEALKNKDGTPMSALDLAEIAPAALLPEGLKLKDPASGATLEVREAAWDGGNVRVEVTSADGKIATVEMPVAELVARGVEAKDGVPLFDATATAAAKKKAPPEGWTKLDSKAPAQEPKQPELNGKGTEPRALRVQLEQNALQALGPAVEKALGTDVDVRSRATPNKDGTVEMKLEIRTKGASDAAIEVTLTIDPKTKTVRVDDLRVSAGLEGLGPKLLGVEGAFLAQNFAGWTREANVGGKIAKTTIETPDAMIALVEPAHGWDRSDVVKVENGKVTVDSPDGPVEKSVADVIADHPGLVLGLQINHEHARYEVTGTDGKGNFTLAPVGVDGAPMRVKADAIYAAAPHAVHALIDAPVVRLRGTEKANGEWVFKDHHGYKLVGVDEVSGLAYVRNPDGKVEPVPIESVVYEHSGVALGAMTSSQHVRYEARLEGLSDGDLIAWAKVLSNAATMSPEHVAFAQRMFQLDYPIDKIGALVKELAGVAQADVGALFSQKGLTQHFSASCKPTAFMFGLATLDPVYAKFLNDHPGFAAEWQRGAIEAGGGSAYLRNDADYAQLGDKPNVKDGTVLQPIKVAGDYAYYAGAEMHPTLGAEALNQNGFWKNRTVDITLADPTVTMRVTGDEKGQLTFESPVGSGKTQTGKHLVFEAVEVKGRLVLGVKSKNGTRQVEVIGLPKELELPRRELGMTAKAGDALVREVESRTGQNYLMSHVGDLPASDVIARIDTALTNGHPVGLAVAWFDAAGNDTHIGHQLWISEKRTVKGKVEYLVYDPHFDEPRWLSGKEFENYAPVKGVHGKPSVLNAPDYVTPNVDAATVGDLDVQGVKASGVLLKANNARAKHHAEQTIAQQDANKANGKPYDEGKVREAEVTIALADDASSRGEGVTRVSKKFKDEQGNVVAEVDVQTNAALFEVSTGKGHEKLAQYDERLKPGGPGNPHHMPVVVVVDAAKIDPAVSGALDARGIFVVDSPQAAVGLNRLLGGEFKPAMDRMWAMEPHARKQALAELLAVDSPKAQEAIVRKYGLDHGDVRALNVSADALGKDASWKDGLPTKQSDAAQKYLDGLPKVERTHTTIIENKDGSITIATERRTYAGRKREAEAWAFERVTFGKDGTTIAPGAGKKDAKIGAGGGAPVTQNASAFLTELPKDQAIPTKIDGQDVTPLPEPKRVINGVSGERRQAIEVGTVADGRKVIWDPDMKAFAIVDAAAWRPFVLGTGAVMVSERFSADYDAMYKRLSKPEQKRMDAAMKKTKSPEEQLMLMREALAYGDMRRVEDLQQLIHDNKLTPEQVLQWGTLDGIVQYYQHSCVITSAEMSKIRESPLFAMEFIKNGNGKKALADRQYAGLSMFGSDALPVQNQAVPTLGQGKAPDAWVPQELMFFAGGNQRGLDPHQAAQYMQATHARPYKAIFHSDGTPIAKTDLVDALGRHTDLDTSAAHEGTLGMIQFTNGGKHAIFFEGSYFVTRGGETERVFVFRDPDPSNGGRSFEVTAGQLQASPTKVNGYPEFELVGFVAREEFPDVAVGSPRHGLPAGDPAIAVHDRVSADPAKLPALRDIAELENATVQKALTAFLDKETDPARIAFLRDRIEAGGVYGAATAMTLLTLYPGGVPNNLPGDLVGFVDHHATPAGSPQMSGNVGFTVDQGAQAIAAVAKLPEPARTRVMNEAQALPDDARAAYVVAIAQRAADLDPKSPHYQRALDELTVVVDALAMLSPKQALHVAKLLAGARDGGIDAAALHGLPDLDRQAALGRLSTMKDGAKLKLSPAPEKIGGSYQAFEPPPLEAKGERGTGGLKAAVVYDQAVPVDTNYAGWLTGAEETIAGLAVAGTELIVLPDGYLSFNNAAQGRKARTALQEIADRRGVALVVRQTETLPGGSTVESVLVVRPKEEIEKIGFPVSAPITVKSRGQDYKIDVGGGAAKDADVSLDTKAGGTRRSELVEVPPRIEAPAVAKKKLPPKEPPFDTKPMDARFKGEQDAIDPTTGAVREMPVRYLSESERSKFELKVGSDGKLYTADGKLYDSDAAADRGSGRAIFVMSKDGRIYVMQPGQKGRFNHSSFLAGEGVAAAGEITVQNGVVTYLSDRSGHYMPETEHTLQLVYRLQGRGADVTKMKVKAWNLPEMSAADFVEKAPSKLPDAQG